MNNASTLFEKYFAEERNRLKSLRDEEAIRRVAAAFGATYGRVKRDSENTKEQIEHIKELRKIINSGENFAAIASVLLESSGKTYVFELDTVELNNGLDRELGRAADMLKQQLKSEQPAEELGVGVELDVVLQIRQLGQSCMFKCMCGCEEFAILNQRYYRCRNFNCQTLYLKSNYVITDKYIPKAS